MSFIVRAPFAVAAALAATATVAAATPAFAAPAKLAATALVIHSTQSGGVSGPRRFCLARPGETRALACRTERDWARRGVVIRLV